MGCPKCEKLKARCRELEQALRLNLAVGPDDPLIVEPVERRLLQADAQVDALQADNRALETIIEGAKCRMSLNGVGRCDTLDDQLALFIQERDALQAKLAEREEFIADCEKALDSCHAPTENDGIPGRVSTWRRIELVGELLWHYRNQLETQGAKLAKVELERDLANQAFDELKGAAQAQEDRDDKIIKHVQGQRADADAALREARGLLERVIRYGREVWATEVRAYLDRTKVKS